MMFGWQQEQGLGRESPERLQDRVAWAEFQAQALRHLNLNLVDFAGIAEELEELGGSDRRELRNRLTVLLMHLLKWECQPEKRSSSWRGTIREQRREIKNLLKESPSLKNLVPQMLEEERETAEEDAHDETGLPVSVLQLPIYKPEEVLDRDFWPGPPDDRWGPTP
jgi:signal transduction histidine kinase